MRILGMLLCCLMLFACHQREVAGGSSSRPASRPTSRPVARDARTFWDRRYDRPEFVYGEEPARVLSENLDLLPRGKVLGLACGEGRNEVFLAEQGFDVTGCDISPVALRKCRELARRRGVRVRTREVDLRRWRPEEASWSVITMIYYHDRSLYPKIKRALKPGGVVVLELWSIDQRRFKSGGPRDPELLVQPGELLRAFSDFRILFYEDRVETLASGMHRGRGAVVRLIARKQQ